VKYQWLKKKEFIPVNKPEGGGGLPNKKDKGAHWKF